MIGGVLRVLADASDIVGGGAERLGGGGMSVEELVVRIIRVVLWIIGILAVGFIIYGGVRYVLSQGDSSRTTAARNTITYALIGLIVAVLAYAIVGFVVDNVGGGGGKEEPEEDNTSEEV